MNTGTVRVDPSNAEQLAAWDGQEGAVWARHAERFDRSIAEHHGPFMAAAQIQGGDRVLDIGCGTGETTREAALAAGDGSALGVDLSSAMLTYARARAEADGVSNVEFLHADAQVHSFGDEQFDVAISRTAAMFFGDHLAAFRNVRRSLRTDGRLVLLTWQPLDGNEWLREIATALAAGRPPRIPPPGLGPFALSEPDRVRSLLTEAGFGAIDLAGVEAPMWFGTDATDAAAFIVELLGWMLEGLDDDDRSGAIRALQETCRAHESEDGVTFASATWITTAVAA